VFLAHKNPGPSYQALTVVAAEARKQEDSSKMDEYSQASSKLEEYSKQASKQ
jgi:hypothetical protein